MLKGIVARGRGWTSLRMPIQTHDAEPGHARQETLFLPYRRSGQPSASPVGRICIVLHDPPLRRLPGRQIEARVVLSEHSAKPSIRLTHYKYPPQHVHRSFVI